MMHFLMIFKKKHSFVLSPLEAMLKSKVNTLSIQKSQYEMDRTYFPVDFKNIAIGYCGHPNLLCVHIKLDQATKTIH